MENALGDAKKALEGSDAQVDAHRARPFAGGFAQAGRGHVQGDTPACRMPAAGSTGDGGEPKAEAKKDEGVIDAEYVDVEDKK